MSNWLTGLLPTMNRSFAVYSGGQTETSDGGISVDPILKIDNIVGSIQTLSGNEALKFGKTVQEADTYMNCLQLLLIQNGDLIIDDNDLQYRVVFFGDNDSAVGRYFEILAKKIIGGQ